MSNELEYGSLDYKFDGTAPDRFRFEFLHDYHFDDGGVRDESLPETQIVITWVEGSGTEDQLEYGNMSIRSGHLRVDGDELKEVKAMLLASAIQYRKDNDLE